MRKLQKAKCLAESNNSRTQLYREQQHKNGDVERRFNIGNKVWLYIPRAIKGLTKKLLYKWHGPYRVVKTKGPHNYFLEIQGRSVPIIVHRNRLKPYVDPKERPTETPGDADVPEHTDLPLDYIPENSFSTTTKTGNDITTENVTETLDDNLPPGTFRIEKIIKSRNRKGIREFLVKWLGYPHSDNTWEPECNILDPRVIQHFDQIQNQSTSLQAPILCPLTDTNFFVITWKHYYFFLFFLFFFVFCQVYLSPVIDLGPLFEC